MIPCKEYATPKAAERGALTATKLTSKIEEEENLDDEPQCPPRSTPPGARIAPPPSQEDEWRLMVNQDPHPDSVAGDSGHGTMARTAETELAVSNKELIGALGGTDENVFTEYCSDIEWKEEEDILIEVNDENVTILQMPAAALTPVQASTEIEMLSPTESPEGKKPCFKELIAAQLSKSAPPLCLQLDYSDVKLVGYTQPPLTNVIPWIKYEAKNMTEPV